MAQVELLVPKILKWEGKFVDHPNDKGGATNKGVTIATWKRCGYDKDGDGDIDVEDLKLITKDDVVYRILKPYYWDRWKADKINNQSVADILVDWVWGSGKWGIIIPQILLKVVPDGIAGLITINTLNGQNQKEFFQLIWNERAKFFNNIVKQDATQKVFLNGWLNRLNDFKFEEQ